MRSIAKFTLTFGLVAVPVKLYTATEDRDVHFHMLHKGCNGRIEYKKFCATEQVEVEADDIVKGYEVVRDTYVEVTPEDFEGLNVTSKHSIEIREFVEAEQLDPIYVDKTYYLEPQDGAEHTYALILDALDMSGMVGISKIVMRDKEHTVAVRAYGPVIAVSTLHYADEVRSPESIVKPSPTPVTQPELNLACDLIKALSTPELNLDKYKDEYRTALLDRLNAKYKGEPIEQVPMAKPPTQAVMNLMDMLKQSIEKSA